MEATELSLLLCRKHTIQEADEALRIAARKLEAQQEIIAQQSRLIGAMRTSLQPFAVAAPSWRGPDDTVIVDGLGHQVRLGHFRTARKLWGTRAA